MSEFELAVASEYARHVLRSFALGAAGGAGYVLVHAIVRALWRRHKRQPRAKV